MSASKSPFNTSGIVPVGPRVLILPDKVAAETASGLVTMTGMEQAREELAQTEGFIVAVGPMAWHDRPAPWAKPGDRVIFAKYAGLVCPGADGSKYRLINDLDVVAIKPHST